MNLIPPPPPPPTPVARRQPPNDTRGVCKECDAADVAIMREAVAGGRLWTAWLDELPGTSVVLL